MDIEIDEKLIKQVAKNANLTLTNEEIKGFEEDFKEIISNFEKLAQADVAKEPSFHPVPLKNKSREDIIEESIDHKKAMKNVNEENEGYIRGPKVI